MHTITIRLLKPGKTQIISYQGVVLEQQPGYALVHARWERANLDLGYVQFCTGDHFYEHFFADRWYNIFELRSATQQLKGWYCNITRPALISADLIESEDLELDLFVTPTFETLRLDEAEFEARGFQHTNPDLYHTAYAALFELEQCIHQRQAPFLE
jgi:protein associated with RNAse G/E